MTHDIDQSSKDGSDFEPLTVRIKTATRLTGIGRSKLYELFAEGAIETVKVGASTLVVMQSLRAFIKGAPRGPGPI
ncbi:Excisionase family DNA binding protein OS=Sphingobium scionense OX=1404341 GN=GGQ90_005883 PE=4 SV=1 [Sphingobium scionense]|uniref:Excisionase family DNA binding protein n=1 Tax=Sphingobium scionense TaxID=1404341 RepID=A0A7W6LX96_9SPHN|nr:helix-turn-helix domain-containing protein [Sphingobium scionense]MBB4152061.1 excisionase family DNA binding protein [Sphingobium scionense]